MAAQASESGWFQQRWSSWIRKRIRIQRDEITSPLNRIPENKVKNELKEFIKQLPGVTASEMDTALELAREQERYYSLAKTFCSEENPESLPGPLDGREWKALVRERESLFSQRGILPIICTISLAAFLQGHFQASINASSLFAEQLGIQPLLKNSSYPAGSAGIANATAQAAVDFEPWDLGIMNALPFFVAGIIGAPLSLPVNYWIGRRGTLGVAALLMVASSIGSAFANTWGELTGVRVISGVAMGLKAVSAPILASETATGYWRGSIILAWQIWVACGIMLGSVWNLIVAGALQVFQAENPDEPGTPTLYLRLILGGPVIPAIALLISVAFCYESPRFYMRQHTPNYDPGRACKILIQVRETRLLALRDLILIQWSNNRRGDNAADETLNVLAFYSNSLFANVNLSGQGAWGYGIRDALLFSFGFGAVNFLFGLPSMKSIDILGRRRWLLSTLPLMCLFLMIAALVLIPDGRVSEELEFGINVGAHRTNVIMFIIFIILFAAAYSPGLGPIPFTLASESFPLSHREAGASVAIAINLFFAGGLTILYPAINNKLRPSGAVGLFSGLNIVAFILVFFLVEETRQFDLEQLDRIFEQPKRDFIQYQANVYLPYYVKRYILWQVGEEARPPSWYKHLVDNDAATQAHHAGGLPASSSDPSTAGFNLNTFELAEQHQGNGGVRSEGAGYTRV